MRCAEKVNSTPENRRRPIWLPPVLFVREGSAPNHRSSIGRGKIACVRDVRKAFPLRVHRTAGGPCLPLEGKVARQYAVTDEVSVSDDLSITRSAGESRNISTSSAGMPVEHGQERNCQSA